MLDEDLLQSIIASLGPRSYEVRNLSKEIQVIDSVLRDKDSDMWKKRDDALRKLASMCLANLEPEAEFSEMIKQIRTSLKIQVVNPLLAISAFHHLHGLGRGPSVSDRAHHVSCLRHIQSTTWCLF